MEKKLVVLMALVGLVFASGSMVAMHKTEGVMGGKQENGEQNKSTEVTNKVVDIMDTINENPKGTWAQEAKEALDSRPGRKKHLSLLGCFGDSVEGNMHKKDNFYEEENIRMQKRFPHIDFTRHGRYAPVVSNNMNDKLNKAFVLNDEEARELRKQFKHK
jgi:hypothetical protein